SRNHAARARAAPDGAAWSALLRYAGGEPAASRRTYGRGTITVLGMPALLELGDSPEVEPEAALPLLPVVGIDDAWRRWQLQRGTPFLRMRELDGRRYLWAVAGDAPEAVVTCEVEVPEAESCADVLTGEAIRPTGGVFSFALPAPGVRVFLLDP
ncbi:MAG: hypothetical protein JW951_02685, partial [Lentisphaerae bacterium]|nr:hypothetical protein [Lentisphaerota bacterium]